MLTAEALQRGKVAKHLTTVENGMEAMLCLRRQGKYEGCRRPDLILLDLKLPLRSGHEVLAEIKADADLRSIPVIVLTRSPAATDVARAIRS